MSFSDLSWEQRYGSMGDEAEGAFEERTDGWARYGFNRPPYSIETLPLFLRYTPDYVTVNTLIEVMGCGAKGLKLKQEKLSALTMWDGQMPVWLWIWSTPKQEHAFVPLKTITKLIDKGEATFGSFREGKAFYGFKPSLFPWSNGSDG
ncbi:MAG TPA: hypothetical protein EYG16_11840 [Deltaproteobacteria bacterium]|nr:hypothetical protein [Deltaproteobacteria bacterium]